MSASVRCDDLHLNDSKSNRVIFVGVLSDVSVEVGCAMVGFAFVKESVMMAKAAVDSALLPITALTGLMIGSEALETEVMNFT